MTVYYGEYPDAFPSSVVFGRPQNNRGVGNIRRLAPSKSTSMSWGKSHAFLWMAHVFEPFAACLGTPKKKLNNDKHKFTHINFYSYNRSLPNKFIFNHQETEAEDVIHEAPVIVSLDIGPRVGESRVLACRDRTKCHLNRKILVTKDQENSSDGLYLHPPQTDNCCNCPKETWTQVYPNMHNDRQ